jgi:hypothetical protein
MSDKRSQKASFEVINVGKEVITGGVVAMRI